jgi:quinol-cytochrome oxidoreductase complex cytochrome b subunit
MTWPHLLSIEFFAAAMISVFLVFMGIFINAPLEELANPNVTPAVAKAPWYFVGLQELLAYFHPTVSGVLAPTFILVGAALLPYIDRGPRGDGGSPRPSDRKVGVVLFSMFLTAGLVVTFLGAFFRGPGYAWTLPWEGLYFAL